MIVLLETKLGEIGAWVGDVTGVAWFRTLADSVGVTTGLLFIVVVLFMRDGLAGAFGGLVRQASRFSSGVVSGNAKAELD